MIEKEEIIDIDDELKQDINEYIDDIIDYWTEVDERWKIEMFIDEINKGEQGPFMVEFCKRAGVSGDYVLINKEYFIKSINRYSF